MIDHVAFPEDEDPETLEKLEQETLAWFEQIRAGHQEAVEEAIYLIRAHALPEEHPLAFS